MPRAELMTDWVKRWFGIANEFASWSKDRSTKVGCVIVSDANQVLSGGYNGFPRGVVDDVDARHERPAKYLWTEHAERNAIYAAARHGVKLEGATLYIPWFPCADCARAIIQVGIRRVIAVNPVVNAQWDAHFAVAWEMMTEAGTDLVLLEDL